MKSLLRLSDIGKEGVLDIFKIADDIREGKYRDYLKGKSVVAFFPDSSLRTRVTFEKGIYLLGGQVILFPPEALDRKEEARDIMGYLNNWADLVVIRHKEITLIERICQELDVPVINAMTAVNHPCEMLADMYALSKTREDYLDANYLFCGGTGNIGLAWKEIAEILELSLMQCCPRGYEMEGVSWEQDLEQSIKGKDIICTDSIPKDCLNDFRGYQITRSLMEQANPHAILNPCPPFCRGEEVSGDVIDSGYFVGYGFKKYLLEVQQAIMIYCLGYA